MAQMRPTSVVALLLLVVGAVTTTTNTTTTTASTTTINQTTTNTTTTTSTTTTTNTTTTTASTQTQTTTNTTTTTSTTTTTTTTTTTGAGCTVPTAQTGYNFGGAGGTVMMTGFNPTGVTCASGYTGTVTYKVCATGGSDYSVSGCQSANTCTCSNGVAATGTACTTNNKAICTGCNPGYALSGSVCQVSTALSEKVLAGSTSLPVQSAVGFEVGRKVQIAAGTAVEEFNEIAGFGSITLISPLGYAHGPGTTITQAATTPAAAGTTTPATTMTATPATTMTATPAAAVTTTPVTASRLVEEETDADLDEDDEVQEPAAAPAAAWALPFMVVAGMFVLVTFIGMGIRRKSQATNSSYTQVVKNLEEQEVLQRLHDEDLDVAQE